MADVQCKISRGATFTSPTFERELDEKSLDQYVIEAAERSFNDIFVVSNKPLPKLVFQHVSL